MPLLDDIRRTPETRLTCSSLNIRLGVDLVASLGKDGVLVPLELAAIVALLISVGAESKSLRALAAGVDNVDVVHLHVR